MNKKVALGDLACEIAERESNPAASRFERFIGLEHYISGNVEITNYGSTKNIDSAMKIFHSGDILVARRNVYLKRAGVVSFDGLTSGDSIVLRAHNLIWAKILPFVLNTEDFWNYANQHADGTMSKRLSPQKLLAYQFSLPSEDELSELATLLWSANNARVAYQKLLFKTDELVKSQFIEMFGSPESALDSAIKISDVADVQVGIVIKPTRYYAEGSNGVKAFRSLNVGPMCVKDGDWVYFTEKAMEETQRTVAHTGDVLVVRSGNPGTSVVVPPEYDGCNVIDLIIAHPKTDRIFPEYLCAYTNFPHGMNQINSQQRGVAQKHFNVGMYNDLKLILPSMKAQMQFVELLKQSDKSKFVGKKFKFKINNLAGRNQNVY